jgi:hypothetical protein
MPLHTQIEQQMNGTRLSMGSSIQACERAESDFRRTGEAAASDGTRYGSGHQFFGQDSQEVAGIVDEVAGHGAVRTRPHGHGSRIIAARDGGVGQDRRRAAVSVIADAAEDGLVPLETTGKGLTERFLEPRKPVVEGVLDLLVRLAQFAGDLAGPEATSEPEDGVSLEIAAAGVVAGPGQRLLP